MLFFKGYISTASSLDETEELENSIQSKTLLMAIYALNKGK